MGGLALHTVNETATDVSTLWLKHCQASWTKPNTSDPVCQLLRELRIRAEMVKITAMCWRDGGEELVTVSKSGLVAVWKVQSSDTTSKKLKVSLAAKFDCGLLNVTVLRWIDLLPESYMLVVGSIDGRVQGFKFPLIKSSYNSENFIMIAPTKLDIWGEEDKIAPTHLASWPWNDGFLLIAVKGAFLLAFYVDKQGNKLSYCAYRCSDISLNGLSMLSESELLIVTRSARMTQISVSLTNNGALNLITSPVESYINVAHMGCYGLNMTLNKVICFILLSVNQSYDHLRLREPSQVVICSVSGLREPQSVLQDPHRPVAELWDCLELLRVQILQKTVVSDVAYPRTALDTMTTDQLVIVLWWTTFAATAEDDDTKHQTLLSLRGDVETLVVSCHFFKRIASLLSCPVDSLTSFQLQSLGLVTKWLRWLQSLPSEFATTLITARTLLQQLEPLQPHFPADEHCAICGSDVALLASTKLFMAECEKKHRMPRCSLSLVQCSQLPYYVCVQCGALGHPQAVEDCGAGCYLCGGVLRVDEDILHLT